MACGDGQDGIPTEKEIARCGHPTGDVVYYHEIADDGSDYEEYWCRKCNFWLTPGAMDEIREREDWNGGLSEDQL